MIGRKKICSEMIFELTVTYIDKFSPQIYINENFIGYYGVTEGYFKLSHDILYVSSKNMSESFNKQEFCEIIIKYLPIYKDTILYNINLLSRENLTRAI